MTDPVKRLDSALSQLTKDEDKISTLLSFLKTKDDRGTIDLNSSGKSSNPVFETKKSMQVSKVMGLVQKHGLNEKFKSALLSQAGMPEPRATSPVDHLECGNWNVNAGRRCTKVASKVCSGCRLVGYCSQSCQNEHWSAHKRDCKHSLKSKDWRPKWVLEGRSPDFIVENNSGWNKGMVFGMGRSLWGNMPALDVLNLKDNEGISQAVNQDFSLAFVASGDLRNIMRTVNELPENYRGSLNLIINDNDPMVVCRNLLILTILGSIPDVDDAIEHALHVWYSVFLPDTWIPKILPVLHRLDLLQPDPEKRPRTLSFGPHSKLNISVSPDTHEVLTTTAASGSFVGGLTPAVANNALFNVMMAPERVDYRERYYCGLEGSHRVAFQEWRQFGIVNPFGGFNAHLNKPNSWLFGPDHRLYLNDSASPFQGWDMNAVFEAGQAHGTTREDIVGCLYFYLKSQLRTFVNRLRSFNMTISLSDKDAVDLASLIRNDEIAGVPSSITFDRIEVSNIVDVEYVGLEKVLEAWGPMLKDKQENKHAVLVGLFMNWPLSWDRADSMKATLESLGEAGNGEVMETFQSMYPDLVPKPGDFDFMSPNSASMMKMMSNLELCHENSKAFYAYLKDKGADEAENKAGVRMRKVNQVVAPRIGSTIGSPLNVLPQKLTGEEKYITMALQGFTFQERYVEWERA